MQHIQARNYTRVFFPRRKIGVIVTHTMESPEKPSTAEDVARWAAGPTAPRASWHYGVDADSVVSCVKEKDVAWAAPGCNHNGIQIEHAGRAGQSSRDWNDPYSQAMLRRSAALVADICLRRNIPAVWLDADDLRRGARGLTTHADVTRAFPGPGRTHWDPGPNFPKRQYLALVRGEMSGVAVLRRRRGYYAWLAWYEGRDDWKQYGPRNLRVRPNVPKRIVPLWWARRATFKSRQRKGK